MKENILYGLKPSLLFGMIGYYQPHGFYFAVPKNPDAPVMKLFKMLAEAIGDDGIKGTAKKNLPLKLCQKIQKELYPKSAEMGLVRSEQDLRDLSLLRWLAQKIKLINFRKGKFTLSRELKKLIKLNKWGEVYHQLLIGFITKYDWSSAYGWVSPWQDGTYIQNRFAFGLHLLQFFGDEEREDSFYAKEYLSLLPIVKEEFLMEAKENGWSADVDDLESLITRRLVDNFALFFGLLSVREEEQEGKFYLKKYFVQKTPLLDEVFQVEQKDSTADVYTFRITLPLEKKIVREIQIQGDATFRELHEAIFFAYHRYEAHMFCFYRKHKKNFKPFDRRDAFEVTHEVLLDEGWKDRKLLADEKTTRIDSVGMKKGEEWEYLFDFGDEWLHDLVLKDISRPVDGVQYPVVDMISGESPSQH